MGANSRLGAYSNKYGTPVFPSSQKPTFHASNLTRNQVDRVPLCGFATSKTLFIYSFDFVYYLLMVVAGKHLAACNDNKLIISLWCQQNF